MAIYIKVTGSARIKIQDPADADAIQEAQDETFFRSSFELCEEDYKFEIEDAN